MDVTSNFKRFVALLTVSVIAIATRAQSSAFLDSLLMIAPIEYDTIPSLEPPSATLHRPEGRQSVGLVLSGGGAKGVAHVGVIKVLEDNNIPIDYVTGTSMGAIVGSLYACGWSPERMLEFFTAPDFIDWASGTINNKYIYYYDKRSATPQWVSFNVNFKKKETITNQIIPSSLISPLPMNIEFLKLYGPYSQQCGENFNQLFVPFRCVASDVYHKHKVVFGEGSVADAVRASMSFPLVFRPIEVNGILLYDGGIYDNFPVNVMEKDFDPDFIIGVSVSGADTKPVQGDLYNQLEDMIIQNNDYSVPADKGIKIQVPVLDFGVLEFDKSRTIYDIGYKTGLSMIDSIKSRVAARVALEEVTARRDSFAAQTPALTFDSIMIKGVKGSQAEYLRYLFTDDKNRSITMSQTVRSYYRAVTDGSLSNLVPQAIFNSDGQNTLLLEATPRRPWTFGVGGYVTTSTNSMLYFSGAYHTLGLNSLDVSLSGWLGQSYFAGMLDARFSLRTSIPSHLELIGVLSKQKYTETEELFFKTNNPKFITEVNNYLRAGYVWEMGHTMKGYASVAGGYISESYFPTEEPDKIGSRDKMQYRVGVLRLGVEGNTLDNQQYPSDGYNWFINLDASYQSSRFIDNVNTATKGEWKTHPVASLEALWKRFYKVGKYWSIGGYASGGVTIQKLNQNYTNVMMHAPAFAPTPATQNYFNFGFRSDNYLAVGLIPMWKPTKMIQVRGDFYGYVPVRSLKDTGRMNVARYDGWFRPLRFIGEVAVICNLPFASISLYGNYLSYPAHNWNFGISFGLYFRAPKLLRK